MKSRIISQATLFGGESLQVEVAPDEQLDLFDNRADADLKRARKLAAEHREQGGAVLNFVDETCRKL